jgi:anthranilate synthase component 1
VNLEPAFAAFRQAYDQGRPQAVWTRLIDDLETPVSAYLKIAHGRPFAFLFESVEGGEHRGRYSIIAMKPDLVWRCRGDQAEIARDEDIAAGRYTPQAGGALDSLRDLVATAKTPLPAGLPPMATGLFGAIGYDMIRLVEHLPDINPDSLGLPDGVMTRPSIVAVFDSIAHEVILVTSVHPKAGATADTAYDQARTRLDETLADLARPLAHPPAGIEGDKPNFTSPISREEYHRIVGRAKDYIGAGDIFQVVPSHRFRAPYPRDPFTLYRSLRRTNPSPYLFYLDFGDFQLAGSSPEILVRLRDGKITIRPIAGTRRRGATADEDLALEAELKADPKERAEHLMLLDLGRNDVGRVAMLKHEGANEPPAQCGPRVRVTDSFFIERYSHVMHLVSNVEGDAPDGLDPVDVVMAALPAGTLSGAPKVRAMEIIDELEIEKRGIGYAGAVGYFGADGSVDTCIVLRTALFKDGVMYVQAGGGVVADSDPDAEYEETVMKSMALRRAAEESWRFG